METINTDCKLQTGKFRPSFSRCANRDVAPLMLEKHNELRTRFTSTLKELRHGLRILKKIG